MGLIDLLLSTKRDIQKDLVSYVSRVITYSANLLRLLAN